MTRRVRALLAACMALAVDTGPAPAAGAPPATPPPPRVTNLEPGNILRHPVAILRGEAADADGTVVRVRNLSSKGPDGETEAEVRQGRFLALVELVAGRNEVVLATPSGEARLPLVYRPPTTPFVVRLVYLTDSSGDTRYQSERVDDPQDFRAKFATAAALLQALTAERMNDEGYGRRTFSLERGEDGRVEVHVVRGAREGDAFRRMSGGDLYGEFSARLEELLPTKRAKNVAIMAFTRFNPSTKIAEAHTALGGGGLGLFGSAGMFTWPSSLKTAAAAFSDTTRVDGTRTHDDSNGRGSYWGLAATTLGAVLHETGHTFDLPHSTDPFDVMTRGFDHLNRAFTVVEPAQDRGGAPRAFALSEVAGFGKVSSPRLAWHRFFHPDARDWEDSSPPAVRVDRPAGKAFVTAKHGLRAVAIDSREPDGGVLARDTLPWKDSAPRQTVLDLADLRRRAGGRAPLLHLIDDMGNHTHVPEEELADPSEFVRAWRFLKDPVPWPDPAAFAELPPGGAAGAAEALRGRPVVVSPAPRVNLESEYGQTQNRATLMLAEIRVRKETKLRLLAGSDDALRVWVNGEQVLSRLVLRGGAPDQDRVEVTLREGRNTVLAEVSNAGGGWCLYLRFEDPSGAPCTVGEDGWLRTARER